MTFLEAVSVCAVIEGGEHWLLRNFTLRREDLQDHVTFQPKCRVKFQRTRSSAMGTVLNEIVGLYDEGSWLRFTSTMEVNELEEGSAGENEHAERMLQSYFEGVNSTFIEIRRRVTAGEIDAA